MTQKKVHWTQTPEGKKKLSAAMKKGWKARTKPAKRKYTKRSPITEVGSGSQEEGIEKQVAYAFGHTQAWIDHYANGSGVPARTLAYRVGQLLQRAARG